MKPFFYPLNLMKKTEDIPIFNSTYKLFIDKVKDKYPSANLFNLPSKNEEQIIIENYWDLIFIMNRLIELYIEIMNPKKYHYNIKAINGNNIYMSKNIKIIGDTVINDSMGPVIISEKCKLNGFNFIEGPAFFGENTLIDNAVIRGPVITGNTCKLSGEIEESFIMDYVNKHHYGFLGHSIIENWVNLGAGTTNSDLKNNYSSIRIFNGEKHLDSGHIKLGCIIGEHSKTAIGTMINTGTVIGPFCNIFGSMLRIKHLKPFSWGTDGYKFDLNKLLDLTKTIMARRKVDLNKNYIEKITTLYNEFIEE